MTARPDAAPAEAEGQGSWADMVRCFQQSMRECIKYMICAVGINTKQNYQENNNILFGRLEGSRNPKRGFWACFSKKSKKMVKSFCRLEGPALLQLKLTERVFFYLFYCLGCDFVRPIRFTKDGVCLRTIFAPSFFFKKDGAKAVFAQKSNFVAPIHRYTYKMSTFLFVDRICKSKIYKYGFVYLSNK